MIILLIAITVHEWPNLAHYMFTIIRYSVQCHWCTGSGMVTATRTTGEEDEGDLVVDEDDSATFGPSQYTEADVVVPSCEEKDREALRDAVIRYNN